MSEATSIQIVLPPEMAALVRAKIASGEYASASEVVQDGLLALRDQDCEVERWLREEAAKSYDEYQTNPSIGIPAEEIMDRVRETYRASRKSA